jgi:two-component system LytT family response regulator
MNIRTIIVDDEPWARAKIASLLSTERDFEIVRSCSNADEAIAAIATAAPQLVFLDVQLPGIDGFGVIEAIGAEAMPLVVFATAYDEHAIRAFDAQALDYLLKPFDEPRFRRTLERVRRELQSDSSERTALRGVLDALPPGRRYLQRIVVKTSGRVVFLKVRDIDWLEGSGNYVSLHVQKDSYLLRDSLNALEKKLDPEQFIRLHRSAIVNVERIRQITPWSRGEQAAVLTDGTSLTIGRAFRARLSALLSNSPS